MKNRFELKDMLADQVRALSEWDTTIHAFESFGVPAPQGYYRQRFELSEQLRRLEAHIRRRSTRAA